MNSVILNAISTAPAASLSGKAAGGSADSSTGAGSFGTTLAGTIAAAVAALKPAGTPAGGAPATIDGALRAKIAKLMKSGLSESEIVSTLAADLAGSVAQALGTPGADARARLKTLFAGVLAPPGDGMAGSLADRMRSLAQRFTKLKDTAVALIEAQMPGQQNRIAGNFLDAHPAKEHPAPASTVTANAPPAAGELDRRIAGAVDRAVPAPEPNAAFAPVPATPAGEFVTAPASGKIDLPGDGRSVKFGAKPAIAGGGDTLLGRVLTRAVLAADARTPTAPVPSATAGTTTPATSTTTATTPAVGAIAGATEKTLIAFMKAFEATLGSAEHARLTTGDGAAAAVPTVATHAATGPALTVGPATAPLRIDTTVGAVATAAPAAAVPVDQSAIVDQVLRGAFLRNTGASSEMRLSLVPQTLGDVTIKLIVTAGNVTAHVVAQTPEVRDALVAAQPQLTKSLADAGLKLQSFTVDLSGNGFTGFSQQRHNAPTPDGSRSVAAMADELTDETGLDAVPTFGPPDSVRSAAGYNYLA